MTQSLLIRTNSTEALLQAVLVGPVIGATLGALVWSVQDGANVLTLLFGGVLGAVVGLAFAVLAAVTTVAAARVAPTSSMPAARRRDMQWTTGVLFMTGVSAAAFWAASIDLEEGRRLIEPVALGVAPAACSLAWLTSTRFAHLHEARVSHSRR